jgi:hypothetical protein
MPGKIKGIGFSSSKPIRTKGAGVTGNKIDNISYVNSPAIGPGCNGQCRKPKKGGHKPGRMNGTVDMTKF